MCKHDKKNCNNFFINKLSLIDFFIEHKFAETISNYYFCTIKNQKDSIKAMQIFGKRVIKKFILKHTIAKNALENWMNTVESSNWKSHADLKQTFPSADYVGSAKYVFDIKGN